MASEVKRYGWIRGLLSGGGMGVCSNGDYVRYSDYAELEAKLAALEWTPITEDNLPKIGDADIFAYLWKEAEHVLGMVMVDATAMTP